jgi:hypothetical protein
MQSAEHYRHLAAHARRMARAATDPELRERLGRQAQEYDDMAYRLEHEGNGKLPQSE